MAEDEERRALKLFPTMNKNLGAGQYQPPARGDGAFDGYPSASDLLIAMGRESSRMPERQPSYMTEPNSIYPEQTPKASDKWFANDETGFPQYTNWALAEAAKETGIKIDIPNPEGKESDKLNQENVKAIQAFTKKLEAKKETTPRENALMESLSLLLSVASGS